MLRHWGAQMQCSCGHRTRNSSDHSAALRYLVAPPCINGVIHQAFEGALWLEGQPDVRHPYALSHLNLHVGCEGCANSSPPQRVIRHPMVRTSAMTSWSASSASSATLSCPIESRSPRGGPHG